MVRFIRPLWLCLIITSLVAVSGCGPRLASEQELDLGSNDICTIEIDPSSSDPTVSIIANSDGAPINVFVYLSEDDEFVDRAITRGIASEKIIASQSESAKISLRTNIPADKEASVRLQTASPQDAKVTLIISN